MSPAFSFKPERSTFDLHDVSDARAAWAKHRRIDVETAARRFGLSPNFSLKSAMNSDKPKVAISYVRISEPIAGLEQDTRQ